MNIHDEAKRILDELNRQNTERVKIALFGQPGAGKSSLINRVTGQRLAAVGVHTDTTTDAGTYEWDGVRLVDLPGYDTIRFPKDAYFSRFGILDFDLFLCVFAGKLHEADTRFFKELRDAGKVCLFVRNKADEIWEEDKRFEQLCDEISLDVRKHVEDPSRQVFFTSCRSGSGIAVLEDAIYDNLDSAKRERWARGAKAASVEFLEKKRSACESYVTVAAGASLANALNPIPGVDIAVDVGVLATLFKVIREAYGLSDERLHELAAGPMESLVREVTEFATRQGVLMLLKRFAGREALKAAAKYIPIVGQVVAGAVGFAITKKAGDWYLDRCHALATQILARDLEKGA